jgi:sugar lactone lactonase YvrE
MSNARNIGDSAPVINFLDGVTSNLQTQLNTLDTAIGNVSVTSGSLTKTFAADETATVTLSGNVLAPVVTATKEVAQTGVTNNDWDAAAGSYTLENSAPSTTLDFVGYDVSGASFVDNFSISAQETEPEGIAFNADGTKMYVVGTTGDDVNEYTLSTGFDVSTATYSQNFDVSSQDTEPKGIAFNADGTKMFVLGDINNAAFEYQLTTGFDVSTASYTDAFYGISAQESSPQDLAFNTDGTKMFILGNTGVDVNEYTLSTGFDVSTASYSQNFSISGQESYPRGLTFNTDGTKMFVVGNSADKVSEYTLSTGFNVSTASYSQNFDVGAQDTVPRGIAFNASGTKMFILGSTGDDVNEYTIAPSSVTLGTGSFASGDVGKTIEANSGKLVLTSTGGAITVTTTPSSYAQVASGSWQMYALVYDSTADVINTSYFEVGFDMSALSYDSVYFDPSSKESNVKGLSFNNDGTKFYVIGTSSDKVVEYSLSEAYDISTASYLAEFSVATQEWVATGMAFKTDGTKMYVIGQTNPSTSIGAVHEYDLSTAFDVTTSVYNSKYIQLNTTDAYPEGMCFSPDGTKLFWVGRNTPRIFQWNMSTAWDISTASNTSNLSVSGKDSAPRGVALNNDGTKIYMVGSSSIKIHEYTLSTPYTLSGATFVESKSLSPDTWPQDFVFNNTGTKLYTSGHNGSNSQIYQFTFGSLTATTGYQPAIASTIDSTYWTDLNSMTATNAVGDGNVFYALSADGKTSWNILSNGTGATFVVTVAGGKFVIDGVSQDSLTLQEGQTYIFDQADATNGTHPLRLSTTSDGTHGGGTEYTTGVTTSGTPGSSGAYTQIVVAVGAPTLYYYCSAHSGMGGTITIGVTGVRKIVKNNSGTYQVNTNNTYGSETWANAATNTEVAALREAMTSASGNGVGFNLGITTKDSGVDLYTGSQDTYMRDCVISSDGSKFFVIGETGDAVYEYGLSTNFDISSSSASYTTSFSVSGQEAGPRGLAFSPDGTRFYICGTSNSVVFQYSMSSAWDISTASYVASGGYAIEGLVFKPDGTSYIMCNGANQIYQYDLSTAWDITSASYVSQPTISEDNAITGIALNADGTKLFLLGDSYDKVYQYSLGTAYTASTLSYDNVSVSVDTTPNGISFGNSGAKLYVVATSIRDVYQYTSAPLVYPNQMTSTQLAAINDASQITLGSALDFATILYYASGSTTPTYSGTAINYDANVINQGAILGTDYTYDAPAQNKVRITSVNAANLKIRVV